jgi:hypothetical protein
MNENMMKQYIELSKEFKKNRKSKEIVEKMYDFMQLLEKDNDNNSKMILVKIYSLLEYHKKAFELYLETYDKTDLKQKAKLFEIEQMAKSHGDNFAVKLKKQTSANRKFNYTINDFMEKESKDNYNNYTLKNNCIIFNQSFEKGPLEILIHNNFELSQIIEKISEHLNWLAGDCKKDLIKYYNDNMDMEEKANTEWYEELEIYGVKIDMTKEGKILTSINSGDNILSDHLLDIEIADKKIWSMNYDG